MIVDISFDVGGSGSAARKLSVLLVVEGLALLTAGFPDWVLGLGEEVYNENPWLDVGTGVLHFLSDAALLALYPAFLAAALGTSLTRPFRNGIVRVTIAVIAVAVVIGAIMSMGLFGSMSGTAVLYIMVSALFLFALIASLHAWRTAKAGIAKTRAGLFAVAFDFPSAGQSGAFTISRAVEGNTAICEALLAQ